MRLLADERAFVGAAFAEDNEDSRCVITTDSRAVVVVPSTTQDNNNNSNNESEMQWILPATSQRFPLPVKLGFASAAAGAGAASSFQGKKGRVGAATAAAPKPMMVLFGVKGGDAKSVVAYASAVTGDRELNVSGSPFSAPVVQLFPWQQAGSPPLTGKVLVVLANGQCELCSVDLAEGATPSTQANAAVYRSKDTAGTVGGVRVVCAELVAKRWLVLVMSNGLVRVLAVAERTIRSERVVNILTHRGAGGDVKMKLACVHRDVGDMEGEFGLSVIDLNDKLWTYKVTLGGEAEPWLVDAAIGGSAVAPAVPSAMVSAPGQRVLLRLAGGRVEAWDVFHGVLLQQSAAEDGEQSAAEDGEQAGGVILAAGSGKTFIIGSTKQVDMVKLADAGSSTSLSRCLIASAAFSSSASSFSVIKKLKLAAPEEADALLKSSAENGGGGDLVKAANQVAELAFENRWFDLLADLVRRDVVRSTRVMTTTSPSPLVVALARYGHVDFCIQALRRCNDVPAQHVAELVKFCLSLARGSDNVDDVKEEDDTKAVKALRQLGASSLNATTSSNSSKKKGDDDSSSSVLLDIGVAVLVAECFLCPGLIESELADALAVQLACADELVALVACLKFASEMPGLSSSTQVLLACAMPLNLSLSSDKDMHLPSYADAVLQAVKSRVAWDLTVCDQAERTAQRLDLVLSRGGGGGARPRSSSIGGGSGGGGGLYHVETCLL